MHWHCTNCSATLWSNYSKTTGICPDCASPDIEVASDLETVLESTLKEKQS